MPFPCLSLANVRRTDLPEVNDSGGKLSRLNLPEDSGLAERIHVCFFPNNIVGADFNFHGPRMGSLEYYFKNVAPRSMPPMGLTFAPLLGRNVVAKLKEIHEVSLFRLRARDSLAAVVRQADESLGDAFEAARKLGGEDSIVEVTLQRGSRSKADWLRKPVLNAAKWLARNKKVFEEAECLQLKGWNAKTERMDVVDLLTDKLLSTKKIARLYPNSRAVNPIAAFEAIREAYEELRTPLEHAASILVEEPERD